MSIDTQRLVRYATARSRKYDREVRAVELTDDELAELLVAAGLLDHMPGQS